MAPGPRRRRRLGGLYGLAIGLACLTIGGSVAAETRAIAPIRVHIVCQQAGRTKACPTLLRAIIDDEPITQAAPRAAADVILTFNVVERGNIDVADLRLLVRARDLRQVAGPQVVVQAQVPTRAADDEQRAALGRGLRRALLPLVEARAPDLVEVSYTTPGATANARTSNLDAGFWVGGHYDWTPKFQTGSGWIGMSFGQVGRMERWKLDVDGSYAFQHQPPLTLDNGAKVDVDTQSHGINYRLVVERSLDAHFAFGMLLRGGIQDRQRLYLFGGRSHLGLSWDLFAADDPRANHLTLAYLAGVQTDVYHEPNVLFQETAGFVSHGAVFSGSMRLGTTTLGLTGRVFGHLSRPDQRYELSFQPNVGVQLGANVDLELALVVTKQAFPGRLETDVKELAAIAGQSYAEPLRIIPQFNLVLHWDRTNTARNNRWDFAINTGQLDNL